MPTISVSKRDLESLLQQGRKDLHTLNIEELKRLLQLAKGEVKSIEGDELRIELADTNRPDLLSVEGIARQIKRHKEQVTRNKSRVKREIIVDAELKKVRPYIGGFLAQGVSLEENGLIALIETQEKLADVFGKQRKALAIGVYNAKKFEFPVYYRAVEPESRKFIPLDFDYELNLREILNQHPKGKEYGYILRDCQKFPFLEDCKGRVLSFPPIINSKLTGEVKADERDIFCEVTGENLSRLTLVVNILAENFKDRGFKIEACLVKYAYSTDFGKDVRTPYEFKDTLLVCHQEFEGLLGLKLRKEKIKEHLEQMRYLVKIEGDKFKITPPSYRRDVMHSVDVIEDFAISRGYDNFEPEALKEFTIGKLQDIELIARKAREIMLGCGFVEIMSNVLCSKPMVGSNMRLSEFAESCGDDVIELENPISESYEVMRNSIIPSLLQVEGQSSKATYPHRIFEVGEVAVKEDAGFSLREKKKNSPRTLIKLSALIAHSNANFSELHSFLDSLAYYLGFSYQLKKIAHPSFIKGRAGSIIVDNEEVGVLGDTHPEVLENFKIKYPVAVFEISLPPSTKVGRKDLLDFFELRYKM